jgi:ferredoxin/flavodoxin
MKGREIDFYYFSGTGNTLLVVQAMQDFFTAHDCTVTLHRMEHCHPEKRDPNHVIGLAFPVACQSTYPFVWDFLRSLPASDVHTEVFMVDTMGAFSGGIVGPLRDELQAKGYNTIGAQEIVMPSNWMKNKGEERNQKKRDAGMQVARKYAHDLLYGISSWPKLPVVPNLFKYLGSEKIWAKMAQKLPIKIDETKCIRCGLCFKLCPVDNIVMDGYPEYDEKCQFCMRCVAFCPTQAISILGKTTEPYRAVKAEELLK